MEHRNSIVMRERPNLDEILNYNKEDAYNVSFAPKEIVDDLELEI